MIMSNDFQFQYAHHCSLPYISFKMKCACIILDTIHQISLLLTSSFFRVRHLKMKEKRINPPSLHKSLLTNGAILQAFDWLEVTLQ